jgi:hypothetical protein
MRNRTAKVRGFPEKTPYELWSGKKLNVSNMRIWGCGCLIHLLKNRDRLDPRAGKGIFIGYTEAFNQYAVSFSQRYKCVETMVPTFFEDEKSIENCKPSDYAAR